MTSRTLRRDASAAREIQAVDLRVMGYSYAAIADKLGYYDRSGARKAILSALQGAAVEQAADRAALVQRELELIDACILGLAEQIRRGVPRAVEVALRASERRARLLGLDAPVRASVTVTDELTAQVMALADELAEQDA